jgi:spore coat protein U-like protein
MMPRLLAPYRSALRLCALLMLACAFLAPSAPARAQLSVSCQATSGQTQFSLDFGTGSTTSTTIGYTCTNISLFTAPSFTLCLGLGTPSSPGTPSQPVMQNAAIAGATLDYGVFRDAAMTQPWTASSPITRSVAIPAGLYTSVSGTITVYGRIATGQNPSAGAYNASIANTVLGFLPSGASVCQQNSGVYSGASGTITASATVPALCSVATTATVDLGVAPASSVNLSGNAGIGISCTKGTPFAIGLTPSNGNGSGAGVMAGTGGNPDKPAYQLRSGGAGGAPWGNATAPGNAGNGVAATGTGAVQSFTVYATMPAANYRPDSYQDTVTVTVNY